MTDIINNPSHYQTETGLEAIDVIDAFFSDDHYKATTFKYLARAGKKEGSDELEDLQKAAWYLSRRVEREIARREAEAEKAESEALIQAAIDAVMGYTTSVFAPTVPSDPWVPFGTTEDGAEVFTVPVHTAEVKGPRTWEDGDDEPTDVKYVLDGEGDRFRREGSDQWTFQASNGKWGTPGIFRWDEVTDLGTVTEDSDYSEPDLTIPELQYGDRVNISLTATTAKGGFVSPKAQGKTGTVFHAVDSQGDVGVSVDTDDRWGLNQWISPEHLDKIVETDVLAEWEKELLAAAEDKFKVGDRVVIADEPELQGGGYVHPEAGGRLGTVASEKNAVGNYRVDPIDGLSYSQHIGEDSLTKALPSQEFKVGDLVRVTGPFKTSCGYDAYPDQLGGVGATVQVARNKFVGSSDVYNANNVEVKEVAGYGSQWVDPASLTRLVDLEEDVAEVEEEPVVDRRDEIKVGDKVRIIGAAPHSHEDGATGEVTRVASSGDMFDVEVDGFTQLLVRREFKRIFWDIQEVPFYLVVEDTDGDQWKVDDDGDLFIDADGDNDFVEWEDGVDEANDYTPFVEVK